MFKKNMQLKCVLLILSASLTLSGHAASRENVSQYHSIDTSKAVTKDSNFEDLQIAAARWGLSIEEWNRYLEIKKGPRGFWSPDLDPIALLALEARDDHERRYYAKMYAIMQDERIKDELLTDRYRREWVMQMYAGQSVVDDELLNQPDMFGNKNTIPQMSLANPSNTINPGDRFIFFVDVSITPQLILNRLIPKLELSSGVRLDIYVLGAKTDKQIQEWARSSNLDGDLVGQKIITLNHDGGTLKKLSSDTAKAQLFLERQGQILRVSTASF